MINPQTFSRNCCQFQFNNLQKKVQPKPVPKEVKKVQTQKQKKISLKNYSSLKHLKLSELTKVSTEIPLPQNESIIQKLDSIDDNLKSRLSSFKEHNPFSSFCIEPIPYHQVHIQVKRQPPKLQKSKSMTKIRFSYTSIQTDTSDHEQVEYKVNVRSQKRENLGVLGRKQELRVSGIEKLQKQENMRSTIQPLLQIARTGINLPRSIISIVDQEEMEDFMKESFIIERHSGQKTINRLL